MKPNTFIDLKNAPKTPGVFTLFGESGQSLFVGVSENIAVEIKRIFAANELIKTRTTKIETVNLNEADLINLYAATISRQSPLYNLPFENQNLYPHLKITAEKFPRLLATRRIETDGAEYFGAFLPKTGVRYLLGFLIDTFGLRGCDIPIDGDLPVPCPQFYRKKCGAPCVAELCSREQYFENVDMARLFLKNERAALREILQNKIEKYSDELEFETAARWHAFLMRVEEFWCDKDVDCSLDDAADSFEIKPRGDGFLIYLITRRKRKILGRHAFAFENENRFSSREVLGQFIWRFYRFHAPKEISVSVDFPNRALLEKVLSRRAGRTLKISVSKKTNQKITDVRALKRAAFEYQIDELKTTPTVAELQKEFSKLFDLKTKINRIEAFDVAHLSGTDFVGAKSVWENGKFAAADYRFRFSDEPSELRTLAETVEKNLEDAEKLPDLILIDGGRAQIQTVLKSIGQLKTRKIPVISAVKPPQRHGEISHFLVGDGRTVAFQKDSEVCNLLLKLRDEAHNLANYIHRSKRETAHFYEVFYALPFLRERERYLLLRSFRSLKAVRAATETELVEILGASNGAMIFERLKSSDDAKQPFIVPVRYDEPNGEAADLQPLFATRVK